MCAAAKDLRQLRCLQPLNNLLSHLLTALVSSAVGALIGVAAGGPFGAVVGAVLGGCVGMVTVAMRQFNADRQSVALARRQDADQLPDIEQRLEILEAQLRELDRKALLMVSDNSIPAQGDLHTDEIKKKNAESIKAPHKRQVNWVDLADTSVALQQSVFERLAYLKVKRAIIDSIFSGTAMHLKNYQNKLVRVALGDQIKTLSVDQAAKALHVSREDVNR